jgi:site-specific DNA-methyltransferase (adenine-specific)
MMADKLQIEWVPIDLVLLNPANPRLNEQAVGPVMASIARFGFRVPLVVNRRTGIIEAGNTRLKAAHVMGLTEVPVIWVDDDEITALAFAIADNRLGEIATWNEPQLAGLLQRLAAEDELASSGFSDDGLGTLLAKLEMEDAQARPEMWEPATQLPEGPTRVQPGDVWACARHRVMCGDSTRPDHLRRLCGDSIPSVCITDPPYGLEVEGVTNDSPDEFERLMPAWARACSEVLPQDALMAAFQGTRTFPICLQAMTEHGWEFLRSLTMYKRNDHSYPWRGWILVSEAILLFQHGSPRWPEVPAGEHSPDTYEVVRHGRVLSDATLNMPARNFPIKPLEVVEDLVAKLVVPGGRFLDGFLGSGTSLIAGEKRGRICCGMELEPYYCDVAISRWEQFTQQKAERIDG